VNIHDLPDEKFDEVVDKLEKAGVTVNCFGSAIANWAKNITDPFDETLGEVQRAIPRMKILGTKLIRIMSYPPLEGDDQMEEQRFERLREIVNRFSDAGLQAVHENCMNYGGMSYEHALKLLENVPGLKYVFDTGNPVSSKDRSKSEPYPLQSSWEFYSHIKEHIAYVHIKDGLVDDDGKTVYTYPGEGKGDVEKIARDLIESGYDGGFSIEPHMVTVVHENDPIKKEAQAEANYKEYGQRMEEILRKCGVAV